MFWFSRCGIWSTYDHNRWETNQTTDLGHSKYEKQANKKQDEKCMICLVLNNQNHILKENLLNNEMLWEQNKSIIMMF